MPASSCSASALSRGKKVVYGRSHRRGFYCNSQILQQAIGACPTLTEQTGHCLDIYFRSKWPAAILHGSLSGSPWGDFDLTPVISAPGKWLHASIPLQMVNVDSSVPLLEFVLTDGRGTWDKPAAGGNYTILGAGRFVVRDGAITRTPSSPPPVLVVSDLDGTMVGDDEATAQFKKFWEEVGVVQGGVLVYNTGRSLQSFEKLLKQKSKCLAHPDILISAVGTKIYNFCGSSWHEDLGWLLRLEMDWDIEVVRQAAYTALNQVGKDVMHFRPPEEQNDHKVTCGVHQSVLDTVISTISATLHSARVNANVIVSGTGDWRFLDLVPRQAGKLEALNYVRQLKCFPPERTVACGDSGNDILMLSGENLALVVGNAQPDLKRWVGQQEEALMRSCMLPDGRKRLLVSGKEEASGILEGLEYWGFKK